LVTDPKAQEAAIAGVAQEESVLIILLSEKNLKLK
jgi:hypothetical protein